MGDHRVTIIIWFSMHDVEDKVEWHLNWSDDIPDRVRELVEKNAEKAMASFYEAEGDRQARIAENAERAEYERLKKKFERR